MLNLFKRERKAHMETTIDVKGLPEDRIQYLKNMVALWTKQAQSRTQEQEDEQHIADLDNGLVFATHPSKVIGSLTRDEIYDHLT
jgi:hypothetical protein